MGKIMKGEGESSVISAYAYGLSLVTLAVGAIWFQKFWSNMYDRVFPTQPK